MVFWADQVLSLKKEEVQQCLLQPARRPQKNIVAAVLRVGSYSLFQTLQPMSSASLLH